MTHYKMQLIWCLVFTIAAGVCVALGSNWWLGAGASLAIFAIHNMMLVSK